jgi:hypothetical protein
MSSQDVGGADLSKQGPDVDKAYVARLECEVSILKTENQRLVEKNETCSRFKDMYKDMYAQEKDHRNREGITLNILLRTEVEKVLTLQGKVATLTTQVDYHRDVLKRTREELTDSKKTTRRYEKDMEELVRLRQENSILSEENKKLKASGSSL